MKKRILSTLVFTVFITFVFLSVSVSNAAEITHEFGQCNCSSSEQGHETTGTCCHSNDDQYPLCASPAPNDCNH